MDKLKRTQIYLTQEQITHLQSHGRKSGQPMAELVREAVTAYLTEKRKKISLKDDPINTLVGAFASDVNDAAVNHDHYIYGVPKKSKAEVKKIYAHIRGHKRVANTV